MAVKLRSQSGFTLIELLVVIAIISLMSSVVLAALNSARSKGRDAKRKQDIHQLELALNLYYSTNGTFPNAGGAVNPNVGWSESALASSWNSSALQTALAPFISKLPVDPINTAGWVTNEYYYVGNFGSWGCSGIPNYMIVYKLENGASTISPGVSACDGTPVQYGGGALNTANASGIITVGDIVR